MNYEKRRIYSGLIITVVYFIMAIFFLLMINRYSLQNAFWSLIAAISIYFIWYFVYPYFVKSYRYSDIKTSDDS